MGIARRLLGAWASRARASGRGCTHLELGGLDEGHVEERDVRVDELEAEGLDDEGVLVLDREHVVVALHPEHRDERLPEFMTMAVPAGSERPGAFPQRSVGTRIEVAVDRALMGVEFGVLCVAVEEQARFTEHSRRLDGIDALPEEG